MPLNIKNNLTLKPGDLQQPPFRAGLAARLHLATKERGCERRARAEKAALTNKSWGQKNDVICLTPSKANAIGFMPPRLPRAFSRPVPTTRFKLGRHFKEGSIQLQQGGGQ